MTKLYICVFVLLFQVFAWAERGDQSGDVAFEDTQEKQRSPYLESQDKAIAWVASIASGVSPGPIDEGALLHLAVTYLFCTIKSGPCEHMLDTLLESDVIASRVSNSAQCPNMRAFWRLWLATDLEQRSKYLVPVGLVTSVGNFNNKERPKYVKCEATVAERIKESASRRSIGQTTLQFLNDIRSKGINVMLATDSGAKSEKKAK